MNIANLAQALTKAQSEIEGAIKDKTNPHFKSRYADLSSVVDALKLPLAKHGLAYVQVAHDKENAAAIETLIIHSSGETLSCGVISVPVSKGDAQGFGSALTYARRYSLSAAFGVAPEDDDGNAATTAKPTSIPNTGHEVNGDEFRALSPDMQTWVSDLAAEIDAIYIKEGAAQAYAHSMEQMAGADNLNELKMAVAYKLPSKTRNAIKAHGLSLRKAA